MAYAVFRTAREDTKVKTNAGPLRSNTDIDDDFGTSQVKRMLNDRIFMDAYPSSGFGMKRIAQDDTIFIWLAKQFGSQSEGLIYWNPDAPVDSAMSDDSPATEEEIGFIRISPVNLDGALKGDYLSFEQLWSCAVFECNLCHMSKDQVKLDNLARAKKITRDDYILSGARLEYNALIKTKAFYHEVWIPWAKRAHFTTDWRIWSQAAHTPQTFEKWIAGYRDKNGYPTNPWGGFYDSLVGTAPLGEYGRELRPDSSPSPE